jgi:hypothetical protein
MTDPRRRGGLPAFCFTKMKGPFDQERYYARLYARADYPDRSWLGERASLLRVNDRTGGQPATETLGPAGSQGPGQLR